MNQEELTGIYTELLNNEKNATERRVAFEGFLALSGIPLSTNGHSVAEPEALSRPAGNAWDDLPQRDEMIIAAIRGKALKEALEVIARMNGNRISCSSASRQIVEAGVGDYRNASAAYSSFYNLLKKDKRYTKVGPGVFQFEDKTVAVVPPTIHAPAVTQQRRSILWRPPLNGRDYSLVPIPPELANFDFNSLRGMNYPNAAVTVARYLGGEVVYSNQISAALWHADFCRTAKYPSDITKAIWSTTYAPARGLFKTLQKGVYKLIAK